MGELKNNGIRNLYHLHNTMLEHELILVYEGEISQKIITSLLSMTERSMEVAGEDAKIKRKIFNVMMECLQNICKHLYSSPSENNELNSAIFMIGRTPLGYLISAGNIVTEENIKNLKERFDQINNLDDEGLKNLYKEVIRTGRISNTGGAGLGLIDIARKSGDKLKFEFNHIEGSRWFYSLQVTIEAN